MTLFLVVFCMLVALGFAIASAISDYRSMTIPNVYAAGIVLAFIPAYLADMFSGNGVEFFAPWTMHLGAAVLVFILSFALFAARVMGAGDSKLCSAVALWTGLTGLAPFLFYMAITGAVLGIATKIMNKKTLVAAPLEGSWIDKSQKGQMGVPYGIAIAVGAIIAFYQLGYFEPENIIKLGNYMESKP